MSQCTFMKKSVLWRNRDVKKVKSNKKHTLLKGCWFGESLYLMVYSIMSWWEGKKFFVCQYLASSKAQCRQSLIHNSFYQVREIHWKTRFFSPLNYNGIVLTVDQSYYTHRNKEIHGFSFLENREVEGGKRIIFVIKCLSISSLVGMMIGFDDKVMSRNEYINL